jgi:hypothetical protein
MNLNPGAVGVSVTTRPVLLAVARTLRGRDSRAFASAPARLLLSRGHLVPSARRLLATGPSMFLSRFTKNSATDMDAPPKEMDAAPSVLGLADRADHSWTRHLNPDPDTDANAPNRKSRQVKSGHYVRVDPTPLRKPECVIYSPDMLGTARHRRGGRQGAQRRTVRAVLLGRQDRRTEHGLLGHPVRVVHHGTTAGEQLPVRHR